MQNGSPVGPREPVPSTSAAGDNNNKNYGRTPLHEAAIAGDDEALERLLRAGADRNSKDTQHGNTPLHEAAWRGYSRCVKLLCALPKDKQKAHKILLDLRSQRALQETKEKLHSALLATKNYGGFSALHLAAQNGHNQSCREILLSGAEPDVQNNYGDTALHTACRYGHAGAVRIIISAKCDVNMANLNGDTALHISCAMGRRKLTRILLESGADKKKANAQGESPRDIATRKKFTEIISILEKTKRVDTPQRNRDRSSSSSRPLSKDDAKRKSRSKTKDKVDGVNGPTSNGKPDPRFWSPYGCHYSPDPKDFPQPRLETLPKEPLKKGEQYYLDLAGNIRKGPVGVGNVCYCAPLFRHLEHRISKSKKHLQKRIHKVDRKVDALALKTDEQLEGLTKSIIADRIRCEDQKLYIKSWLKRGMLKRQSLAANKVSKDHETVNTLTRARSLEAIDVDNGVVDYKGGGMKTSTPAILSRSVDLLDCHNVVTVHRADDGEPSDRVSSVHSNMKNHPESDRERTASEPTASPFKAKESSTDRSGLSDGRKVSKFKISKEPKYARTKKKKVKKEESVLENYDRDSLSESECSDYNDEELHASLVTKRLEKLLLETKSMLQREKVFQKLRKKDEAEIMSPDNYLTKLGSKYIFNRDKLVEHIEATRLKEYDKTLTIEEEMEMITQTLAGEKLYPSNSRKKSGHSKKKSIEPAETPEEINTSDENEQYVDDMNDLSMAVQQHYSTNSNFSNHHIQDGSTSESDGEDDHSQNELEHEPSPMQQHMANGFFTNTTFQTPPDSSHQSPATVRETPDICRTRNLSKTPVMDSEFLDSAQQRELNELKSKILSGTNWRSNVLRKSVEELRSYSQSPEVYRPPPVAARPSLELPQEVEPPKQSIDPILTSEDVVDSKPTPPVVPSKGLVRRLVSRIQKSDTVKSKPVEPPPPPPSSTQYQQPLTHLQQPIIANGTATTLVHGTIPMPRLSLIEPNSTVAPGTMIPKDAYFHELPNRQQRPQSANLFARNRNPLPLDMNDHEMLIQQQQLQMQQQQREMMNMHHVQQQQQQLQQLDPYMRTDQQMRYTPTINYQNEHHQQMFYTNGVQPAQSHIRVSPPQHQIQPAGLDMRPPPVPPHKPQHLMPYPRSQIADPRESYDRESQNDSGYSGRMYGPSPSPISAPTFI